jgi:ribosomal protein L7/L12
MPNRISNETLEAIRSALAAGRKIDAIKLYREASGAGLAEAKNFVERLERGASVDANEINGLSDEIVQQIQAAVFAGQKIEAIRLHRTATGMGLKESKDFVEALEARLRSLSPGEFAPPRQKGCSMMLLVMLLMIASIIQAFV